MPVKLAQNISIIEKSVKEGNGFSGETYRSVFFLHELTGLRSNANFGDVTDYSSTSDFRKDKKAWLEWLNSNVCTVHDSTVLRIEKAILNETNWISLPSDNFSPPNE